MLIETVLAILLMMYHFKKASRRPRDNTTCPLGVTLAIFKMLVHQDGLNVDKNKHVQPATAQFIL
jgi:hypothetical protein